MFGFPRIEQLTSVWRARVPKATRRGALSLLLVAVLGATLLAREGTPLARGGAWAVSLALLLAIGCMVMLDRRTWAAPRRALARVLTATDRGLAARALRALRLAEQARSHAAYGSSELAELHLDRLLSAASPSAIERVAERKERRLRSLGRLLLAMAGTLVLLVPMHLLEGANVMLSHRDRAPFHMRFLRVDQLVSQPPTYLRRDPELLHPGSNLAEPQGTELTVRGAALRPGRSLVLTDGKREVSFVSDGEDGLVARWVLSESADLRVAARFGEVLVEEPDALTVVALPDAPPTVELEQAPRAVRRTEMDRLELRYVARDDHGLRQIDLVLRAGAREERRVIGRFDASSTRETGAHVLRSGDPFLKQTFLPVEVTIEARDNDAPAAGKWGASAPITIVPPGVGEPEAARISALMSARGAVVDALAALAKPRVQAAAAPATDVVARAAALLREAARAETKGAHVPAGVRAFLDGQADALDRVSRAREKKLELVELAVLGVDAAVNALSLRDARRVAGELADVAEEARLAAAQARALERPEPALERLRAAVSALEAGGSHLFQLGALGQDLGSVALADTARIGRAQAEGALVDAELAARHLAARLRRPNPSFGAVGRGGVESGSRGGHELRPPSQADAKFDAQRREIDELVQDHARVVAEAEAAVAEARAAAPVDALREEAKRRAQALRDALSDLPLAGARPESGRSSAALGREHGHAMADSLERGDLEQAVAAAENAAQALDDAERRRDRPYDSDDRLDVSALNRARRELADARRWAEQALEKLQREAENGAQDSLRKLAGREQKLAERASELSSADAAGEAPLPDDVSDRLRDASRGMRGAAEAMRKGDAREAIEQARDAQRALESARTRSTSESEDGEEEPRSGRADVPDRDDSERTREFRRRVLDGLGRAGGGRLAPAVKRYAEELLR